ncbi:DNA polymerase IV [Parvularcula lutaonensis]|uniref:DNA polymerase IV n=1 Tax=Parvularcula lutaonensis TaxID=491923 RepID=A0ABV7ME49_9PROT|nr:DNA polymerase IV [Parvularcula lutaonensis]GGY54468.1 DNA polymerase IV [Parvularcula lutaonensis]
MRSETRLCLGCGEGVTPGVGTHCPSFRVIEHTELSKLSIAHVDCDAFFASVEKRDNPALQHQPVVVGGRERGVVAAACYIARTYGIHSAMPSFQAKKLCPHAIFVKPRFEAYSEASRKVRAAMEALTPLVEQVSIDEAFLDLSGTERLHGRSPAASLISLQRTIENDVGVTVSVGLSHNKSLAKMASDLDKPRGFAVIGAEETLAFLAPKAVNSVHGVGKAFAEKLRRDGIETIGDVQKRELRELVERYGEAGMKLHARAMGKDPRRVKTDRATKSISGETTFSEDISDQKALEDKLYAMCVKVSLRAKAKQYAGLVVTLKLKTNRFRSLTRRRTLGVATNLAEVLFEEGRALLREELQGSARTSYRLIGIGISDLVPADSARQDLAYPEKHEKLQKKEDALDALRARFGDAVIGTMRDRRTAKR